MTPEETYNVLFLCTGNSARSIMGEAVLNRIGRPRFRGFSAGSHPTGEVNPLTIRTLRELREATEGLRSKSWDEFAKTDAPAIDFVFTVCSNAAAESCPIWAGQPMTAHWGVDDPAAVIGDETERLRAFQKAYWALERRIRLFTNLRIASLDSVALQRELRKIGDS